MTVSQILTPRFSVTGESSPTTPGPGRATGLANSSVTSMVAQRIDNDTGNPLAVAFYNH